MEGSPGLGSSGWQWWWPAGGGGAQAKARSTHCFLTRARSPSSPSDPRAEAVLFPWGLPWGPPSPTTHPPAPSDPGDHPPERTLKGRLLGSLYTSLLFWKTPPGHSLG